jgi:hypothetical protein
MVVGNKVDVCEPDILGYHGYDFVSNSGSIVGLQEEYCDKIRTDFRNCNRDISKLNIAVFSKNVRFLCHYATDAHTIGQISSEFWGSRGDDKFDAVCEFIPNKKAYSVTLRTYVNKDQIISAEMASMRSVYNTYRSKAKKWNFIFSGDIVNMARNAVRCGAEFSASWVKYAWDTV